jgi:hypothetical protein
LCGGSQGGNRGEQLAAVPDRGHPEGDQIVSRKLWQDRGVNIAFAKRVLILLKAHPF